MSHIFTVGTLLIAGAFASPLPNFSLDGLDAFSQSGSSFEDVDLLQLNDGIAKRSLGEEMIAEMGFPDAALLQLDDGLAKRSLADISIGAASIGGKDFPDPSTIQGADGAWYAFATRSKGSSVHVQVATSSDFEIWDLILNEDGSQYDILPDLPAWVAPGGGSVWAPDVVQVADGSFVLYYSAAAAISGAHHFIGAATASNVLGPYIPVGSDAMFCPIDQGGAIDPSGFMDDGQRYVVYKVDGNGIGHGGACGNDVAPFVSTPIVLQPVQADGVTFDGPATTILDNAGASDQGIVEAPALMKSGTFYVLFFSSNCFSDGHYTLSYATATSVAGPYTRADTPLLQTGDRGFTSPGGAHVHADGQHMVFHATHPGGRAMYPAFISVSGNVVSI
ncbi:hypothetical protein LTR17_022420 [Elasticomyces elasticus]|nr:hypothetical protein LTR17_022420 [Elasticomyces elasticus]